MSPFIGKITVSYRKYCITVFFELQEFIQGKKAKSEGEMSVSFRAFLRVSASAEDQC
jgi:hypothetical protein